MDNDNISHATLRDLASEIGQVQIYWCFLENEMRSQLATRGTPERASKGPIISHWRTYMGKFDDKSDQFTVASYLGALEKAAKCAISLRIASNPFLLILGRVIAPL